MINKVIPSYLSEYSDWRSRVVKVQNKGNESVNGDFNGVLHANMNSSMDGFQMMRVKKLMDKILPSLRA